jgi:hypothetical protein
MKTITKVGTNGKKVTFHVPQTSEDAKKLEKLEQAGMLDGRLSFGDDGCAANGNSKVLTKPTKVNKAK